MEDKTIPPLIGLLAAVFFSYSFLEISSLIMILVSYQHVYSR